MKISNCCGASPKSNGDCDTEDFGICPECREHCEYIEEDEDNEEENQDSINIGDKIILIADVETSDGEIIRNKSKGIIHEIISDDRCYVNFNGSIVCILNCAMANY